MASIEEFEEGFNEFFRIDDDKLRRMIAATNPDDSVTWIILRGPCCCNPVTSGLCADAKRMVPAMASPTEEEVELIENVRSWTPWRRKAAWHAPLD
jgi:hypothetical protein